jgi:predicted dehydrogenase
MIDLAVIGAGYWGTKLVGEYLALSRKRKDVRLRAVADVSAERLSQISKTFSLSNSMLKEDYAKLLDDPKITGVHIATPYETHYDIAAAAVAAGKHVLLEKPMCLSSSDALRLARNAEKDNIVLLVGHIFRFNNAINKIKELVEKRQIRDIRCVELRWTTSMPPASNRDIILDLAPHPIDILNHVLEEWPIRVYVNAHGYTEHKVETNDVAFATLSLPQDVTALVILSWIHRGPRQRTMTIVSKDSTVKIEAVEQTIVIYQNGQTREIPIEPNNTIGSEIEHFVERIQNNDPPINSALTGIMNTTVLEAMRRSLQGDEVQSVVGG